MRTWRLHIQAYLLHLMLEEIPPNKPVSIILAIVAPHYVECHVVRNFTSHWNLRRLYFSRIAIVEMSKYSRCYLWPHFKSTLSAQKLCSKLRLLSRTSSKPTLVPSKQGSRRGQSGIARRRRTPNASITPPQIGDNFAGAHARTMVSKCFCNFGHISRAQPKLSSY